MKRLKLRVRPRPLPRVRHREIPFDPQSYHPCGMLLFKGGQLEEFLWHAAIERGPARAVRMHTVWRGGGLVLPSIALHQCDIFLAILSHGFLRNCNQLRSF
jgi:hypothetical protein